MATRFLKCNNPNGRVLFVTGSDMNNDQVDELLTQIKENTSLEDTGHAVFVSNHNITADRLPPRYLADDTMEVDDTMFICGEDMDVDDTDELRKVIDDSGALENVSLIITNFPLTIVEVM